MNFLPYLIIVLCLLKSTPVYCQQLFSQEARNTALSEATVAATYSETLFGNLAGTAETNSPILFTSFLNRFQITAFSTYALGVIYPTSYGVPSLTIQQFGDQVFHEQLIGLGYSHKIRYIQLGARLNYFRVQAENQPSQQTLIAELGGIVRISSKLLFAAYIYNLNQARDPVNLNLLLPAILKMGVAYHPLTNLSVFSAITKPTAHKESFHLGVEYFFHKNVAARTGINTFPLSNSFGIGITVKRLKFNYALQYSKSPGTSHELSLNFQLKEKKNSSNNKH